MTTFVPPKQDFPLLVNREPIVYLDNAATTQKPDVVINALVDYYSQSNANVHRGVHQISDEATGMFEDARKTVAKFVNASAPDQILFTRGTTESLNLVAYTYAPMVLNDQTTVLITEMEHHSNFVPWQLICECMGAKILAVKVNSDGTLNLDHFRELLTANQVAIVAINHVSNVLGTINPIREITKLAHERDAKVVIDGAQAAAHVDLDVQELDCDFYAFSSHKMYGPTGFGILYGRAELLREMGPWQGGGEMIKHVSLEKTTFQEPPHKFEAGTPDISGAIGLAAAIEYLAQQQSRGLSQFEGQLLSYATDTLLELDGLRVIGTAPEKCGALSFLVDGTHPHDLGTLLNEQQVAVRTGHHCAIPLMEALAIPGTVRASFGLYNSKKDVDRLYEALKTAVRILRK
ncbi:MAG: SufS family cysteine desulfurase [Gammaproteobacteria bacterium]|nr:SufS family cysteine desulfurase [Gammaproteobacteria bacterium]MYI77674.1 SufS family cysteine desulfurase [Gammaproteobacteria bacterium]